MHLTLLFTLGLSLQVSAVPFPAGSDSRGDLQRRKIINKENLSDEQVNEIDSALKQEIGKSVHDKDLEVEIVSTDGNAGIDGDFEMTVLNADDLPPSPPADDNGRVVPSSQPTTTAPSKPAPTAPSNKPVPTPFKKKPLPTGRKPKTEPVDPPSLPPVHPGKFRSTDVKNYLPIVNDWRNIMGLSEMTQSSDLEKNALRASQQSSPMNLQHTSNMGEGQVMAPGKETSFEYVFVGGWLCEMPGLKGIASACDVVRNGVAGETAWTYGGQTGHAELLSDKSFTKIGCAHTNEVWTCNLA